MNKVGKWLQPSGRHKCVQAHHQPNYSLFLILLINVNLNHKDEK